MVQRHDYGLDWIDQDRLYSVTEAVFKKSFGHTKKKALPPDPFTMVSQAKILDSTLEDMLIFEELRSSNKSLSNEVGLWHQKVLGLADNWEELGSNGGGVDLKTRDGFELPTWGKPCYAEVKNRFNTIKASDEKNLWDRLDNISKPTGSIVYLIQIVPETPSSYDEPWRPSGRQPKPSIRCCDGVTGYSMVFNRSTALYEIYMALPDIFDDVYECNGISKTIHLNESEMEELFYGSFPKEPAIP